MSSLERAPCQSKRHAATSRAKIVERLHSEGIESRSAMLMCGVGRLLAIAFTTLEGAFERVAEKAIGVPAWYLEASRADFVDRFLKSHVLHHRMAFTRERSHRLGFPPMLDPEADQECSQHKGGYQFFAVRQHRHQTNLS